MLPDTRQRLEEAFRELQGLVVSRAVGLVGWVARTCWCSWLLMTCEATVITVTEGYAGRTAGQSGCRQSRSSVNALPQIARPAPPQDELGGELAGSEELAAAEEQIAAVQPLFA